jgi:hypothetical protein
MKLLTSRNQSIINAISASSEITGLEAANLLKTDPGIIWKAETFSAAGASIVLALGTASPVDFIWLNNGNFSLATIQANNTDSWASPAVSKNVELKEDDLCVNKGFFALSEIDYEYVRIFIPYQDLLDDEALPWLGNIILGKAEEAVFSGWNPSIIESKNTFISDGGNYHESKKGHDRHRFDVSLGDTKEDLDSAPLKKWEYAVVFTDLEDPADSYLVWPPSNIKKQIKHIRAAKMSFVFMERNT